MVLHLGRRYLFLDGGDKLDSSMSKAKLLIDVEDTATVSLYIWDVCISLYTDGAEGSSVDSAIVASADIA